MRRIDLVAHVLSCFTPFHINVKCNLSLWFIRKIPPSACRLGSSWKSHLLNPQNHEMLRRRWSYVERIRMIIDDCVVTEHGLLQISRGGSEASWLTAEWACSVLKCHCKAWFLDRRMISGQVQTLNPKCFSTQRNKWLVYMCGALYAGGQDAKGPVNWLRILDMSQ